MESKVKLSTFTVILTTVILGILYACCILTLREGPIFFILLSIMLILVVTGCLYAPWKIKVSDKYIVVRSIFMSHRIPLRNVVSVETFQPTMGALRICASGGFMGYWGIFKEGDIGRYVAYYGKASDCFIVRMKNGDKYVLGCKEPVTMVAFIDGLITKKA